MEFTGKDADILTVVYKYCEGALFFPMKCETYEDPNQFRIHQRVNHCIYFENCEYVLPLIDCSAARNHAVWYVHKKTLDDLSDDDWGSPPRFVKNWEMWKKNIKKELTKLKMSGARPWSVAKILTCKVLFAGVGVYNLSEICARLLIYYGIVPWDPVGPLSLNDDSILMKALAIASVFIADAKTF